jgi:hypothetical protein
MKQNALRALVQIARAQKMKVYMLSLAFIAILFTGCSSIVDGGPRTVNIRSDPPGAKVTIYDRRGREVSENTTPATVLLNRGGFFRTDSYRLNFDMAGYQSCEMSIKPKINPWYWGNFLFLPFSPIGFLVDPGTGAMWTITPTTVNCNLRQ